MYTTLIKTIKDHQLTDIAALVKFLGVIIKYKPLPATLRGSLVNLNGSRIIILNESLNDKNRERLVIHFLALQSTDTIELHKNSDSLELPNIKKVMRTFAATNVLISKRTSNYLLHHNVL